MSEKKMKSYEEYKNSEDIIERTVYWIAQLSPHNLWKGDEAIRDLIKQERIRYGEWLIGEAEESESFFGSTTIDTRTKKVLEEKMGSMEVDHRNKFRAELRQRNRGEIE
jgi:hypothetical protein